MDEERHPRDSRRQSQNLAFERRGFLWRLRSLLKASMLLDAWDTLVAASIFISMLFVIFQVAFDAGVVWQWILIYIADALFIASMIFRFLTGYMKRGVLVTERKLVILHYLKRSFSVDLFSVVPFEVFALAAGGDRGETLLLAAFLRLFRCIRCYRVWTLICKQKKIKFSRSYNSTIILSLASHTLESLASETI